jgi:hypothetical protein
MIRDIGYAMIVGAIVILMVVTLDVFLACLVNVIVTMGGR